MQKVLKVNDWKNKRVFISGGAGVIGTALVEKLQAQGANLFIGDLKPKPQNFKTSNYREGDLNTLNFKEIEAFNPEIYFHLAATFERSEETADFWLENYHHNVALSHHLLKTLKSSPALKKIIFASSYLIYNPALYLFPNPQNLLASIKEDAEISPRNLCGMAKLFHERELESMKHFHPDLQIINARIFRSYGKNSRDIISRWIQSILKIEKITVYNREGIFDYIYAEDVANGLIHLADSSYSGIVNLGSGHSRSVNDVLACLKTNFGNFSYQEASSESPFEASQADMTLFHKVTQNRHNFLSLEETIPKLIQYYSN